MFSDSWAGNAFFVVFYCYPAIVNTVFATFICTNIAENYSILDADDRVLCDLNIFSYLVIYIASLLVIVLFACGVPIWTAFFMHRVYSNRSSVSESLQQRVSARLHIDLSMAEDLVGDIRIGGQYGFLVNAYRPTVYFCASTHLSSPKFAHERH